MMTRMSNATIAPLAQHLAEENNVDWRTLQGSGDGGSVVENDVLEYLARVMSGEEATNPTPEPVPEGMSAWPEEPQRRREVAPEGSPSPFTVPTAPPEPESKPENGELASPWTLDVPEPVQAETEVEAFPADDVSEAQGLVAIVHDAPPPAPGVPEAVHDAVVAELTALKTRLAGLEEERLRHVNELHQLSRMQETIALQRDENAKLGALRGELEGLKEALAASQSEAQRVHELEAHSRDLEERLERARAFRDDAKTEFDRLSSLNAALEGELAALKKRAWWQFWG